MYSCSVPSVEKGVSFKMATERKLEVSEVSYHIYFDIPREVTQSITATNTIQFQWNKTSAKFLYIDFNASAEKILNLVVNGKKVDINFKNEHLLIPTEILSAGDNEITIEFVAGDLSLNRNPDYLYTLFVPDRASTCFPTFDQPDIKASFNLELRVPEDWEAVSNGKSSTVAAEGRKKLYQFSSTKPISTYQFAFAAGKFSKAKDSTSGMTMYYRETDSSKVASNLESIFEIHRQSREWLEGYTTILYPFQKLDFVLIPTFQYGGMEHPGNIFYRESSLILEKSASINQKLRRANLIAHETAHMWFGNLVTMKWFNDVWLKEVFANFMAAKIVNPQFPEIDHDLKFLMGHYPSAYAIDRSDGSHPIQQELGNLKNAGTLYGAIIYQKAPIMMRNLETMMGKENFQKGLQDYLKQYSFGNATWNDLVSCLKRFTNKDLEIWNMAWIKSKGMPVLKYESGSNFKVRVTNDSNKIIWPQLIQYQLIADENTEIIKIDIENAEGSVNDTKLNPNIVIPNYGGRGYGYFKADELSRQYLLSNVNTIENTEARAGIWLNIWEYTLHYELNPRQTLETTLQSLDKEKNPLILEYLTNNLETLFWQLTRPENRQVIGANIDKQLFEMMSAEEDISLKRIFFNCFRKVVNSQEGISNLEKFWRNEITLGLDISEQDHIQLAYELAVRKSEGGDDILYTQFSQTKNPDRKESMAFIIPALSSDEAVRDKFFNSLKNPENRAHEPWVLEALSYLHHPLRTKQSVKYIKPSLELLGEIQLTGDIFFPKGWVDQTVSGYQSSEAAHVVRQFLLDNPKLSPNLKNKLLQSADMLFRAEKILTTESLRPM
ncbi:MAG TPA: M1 family aminopeptidase [Cyclobacteriaceae bacterium]